jgi:cytochrome b subunit of formate dehydrogenase
MGSDLFSGSGARSDPNSRRIERHKAVDRIFHWVTAASVIALLATGLLPVVGLKFPWVTIHWCAGVVLTIAVLVHLARSLTWRKLRCMWIWLRDLRGERAAKYTLAQKLMHHAMSLMVVTTIATGLPMLARVDTPFWERDPYLLSASTWGVIYVLHGLAALVTLTLTMIHIYFGLLPEKRAYLRSMLRGWMALDEVPPEHDPARWPGAPR